jgi:hypothetical protein
MALNKTLLAFGQTGVKVYLARATGAAGSPGTFTEICINGTFDHPKAWTEGGDDDGTNEAWCKDPEQVYPAIILEQKTMETTINTFYEPGSAFQLALEGDFEAKNNVYARFVYTDTQATPASKTYEYIGKILNWPQSTPGQGQATTLAFNYRATGEKPGGGWPTS